MKYFVPVCGLLALAAAPWAGAEVVQEEESMKGGPRQVYRMTVTPADEPTPPFKHRLTLLPHELLRGNSVAYYMRAFPEGGIEVIWRRLQEIFGDDIYQWVDTATPLSKLPMDKFREATTSFGSEVAQVVRGGRCRDVDWGIAFEDVKGSDVIYFLLPEVQAMRNVSRVIALRTRLAIVDKSYAKAIDLLRTNYRLGRDVAQQPILVSGLVGVAICQITNDNLLDLIAAPDSPNMYWAVSELPDPMVSFRDALRLELAIGPRMFECLDSPEDKDLTYDEWNSRWKRSAQLGADFSGPSYEPFSTESSRFEPLFYGLLGYQHARERLVAWGHEPAEVDAMPVGKVMSLYSSRVYETIAGEYEKLSYQDYQTSRAHEAEVQRFTEARAFMGDHPDREIFPVATGLLPAVTAARSATFRLDRDMAALRVIEALRMHAAREGGWPRSLTEVTCVPVPVNPATDKPFAYELDGETAILTLPMSDGFRIEKRFELVLSEPKP